MRRLLCMAMVAMTARAQYDLYACAAMTKEYVVGAALPPSGLFVKRGEWRHVGYNLPFVSTVTGGGNVLYLAAGNGLHKAEAPFERWRQLTGHDVTELRDAVAAEGRLLIAHSAGVRVSGDDGKSWRELAGSLPRAYTETVREAEGGALLAGTEMGVMRTEDGGKTWKPAGAAGLQVLSLERAPWDGRYWLAATEQGGLYESRDGGRTFESAGMLGLRTNVYDVAFDATTQGRVAVGGWGVGVAVSTDGGRTWVERNAGLPAARVTRVAFDPAHAGRLYAAVHEEALYVSEDAGLSWKKDGLEGAQFRCLKFLPAAGEAKVEAAPAVSKPRALQLAARVQNGAEYEGRLKEVVEKFAHGADSGYASLAAKLYLKEDAAGCSKRLLELVQKPTGDMFWMFPAVAVAYLDRGQLSAEARGALRDTWRTYAPYRGDTENHFLLYYTSLYLMAQMYAEDGGASWFNGKSSKENMAEARAWIESWIQLTTRRGQGEYDSPHYAPVFLIPMAYLSQWAEDEGLRRRAAAMVEYLMADYAAENLNGTWVGAHSRVYDAQLVAPGTNVMTHYGWAWFGVGERPAAPSGFLLYYLLAGPKEPDAILKGMATDRARPYTHFERKRTRNRWRKFDERHGAVYKTTYVAKDYAVGSDQGGVLQPIQQHSWDVTWAGRPEEQSTFFTLNPHSSLEELQTYFVFTADSGLVDVVRSKKQYDSPDKFSGGSPYEQVGQAEDAVVALYEIAPGARFPQVNGFFSKDLEEVVEDASGWLFLRARGVYIAYRPLQPYVWKEIAGGGRRLVSPYLHNGSVVQAAAKSEYATFGEFQAAVRRLELRYEVEPRVKVRFRTLRGKVLEMTYGERPKVDGRALDYEHWPLYGGPYVESAVDSGRMTLRYGGQTRTLDLRP